MRDYSHAIWKRSRRTPLDTLINCAGFCRTWVHNGLECEVSKIQRGFTLIEMVTVIVILGIVAAVAFPKFQALSNSAQSAVVNGVKAAFVSGAVIYLAKNSGTVPTAASVEGNMNYDNTVTAISGNCTTGVFVSYVGSSPVVSISIPATLYSGFCSG